MLGELLIARLSLISWHDQLFLYELTRNQQLWMAAKRATPRPGAAAGSFHYPGQLPWMPIVDTEKCQNRNVVFGVGDVISIQKFKDLGAVWVEIHGTTMINYTYDTHIFVGGELIEQLLMGKSPPDAMEKIPTSAQSIKFRKAV